MYYGDAFKVECPTGSGRMMTLYQVAEEISNRLANMFLKNKEGRRPVYGGSKTFQEDPRWRDLILFYEYFHGDNGAGLGASHQTGWTGIVARGLHMFATTTAEQMLQLGKSAAVVEVQKAPIETPSTIETPSAVPPEPLSTPAAEVLADAASARLVGTGS
jgi:hypothetical protein